jgi:hypothetical protein
LKDKLCLSDKQSLYGGAVIFTENAVNNTKRRVIRGICGIKSGI